MKKIRLIGASLVLVMLVSVFSAIAAPRSKVAEAGTPSSATSNNGSQVQEQKLTEDNQLNFLKKSPAPKLDNSLERENLVRRLKFLNNNNQLGYVYLLSLDGKVISEYTIKGKVSSLNSLLTTPQQLRCPGDNSSSCVAVDSPDLDGSYGKNPDGVFFFTTEGILVEWSGTYMYSSQKLNIQTPLSLTRAVQ